MPPVPGLSENSPDSISAQGNMDRRRIILTGIAIAGTATVVVLLYLFPPEEFPYWPKCLLYQTTGLYCPGCGCTRALAALLHGDIHKCFTSNILFIPSILVAVILLLFPKLMKIRCLIWSIITIVVLFFILRNLPWQPFCLLAPH